MEIPPFPRSERRVRPGVNMPPLLPYIVELIFADAELLARLVGAAPVPHFEGFSPETRRPSFCSYLPPGGRSAIHPLPYRYQCHPLLKQADLKCVSPDFLGPQHIPHPRLFSLTETSAESGETEKTSNFLCSSSRMIKATASVFLFGCSLPRPPLSFLPRARSSLDL